MNEVFYSLQGEGMRAGTANVFVRFSGCNLACNGSVEGEAYQPVCDTEFLSGRKLTADELVAEVVRSTAGLKGWAILTGGEPSLQLDEDLLQALKRAGIKLAIETNGTNDLPVNPLLDWITVSPKTAEHTIKVRNCNEVKYVRHYGQGIPKTTIVADHYLISPAFSSDGSLDRATLTWCINLVKENPKWRLSVQQHKTWAIR